MTWSLLTPADTDQVREGDDEIRDTLQYIEDALSSHGYFPGVTTDPVYHYRPDIGDTASRPTNGEGGFYFDTDTQELLRDNGSSWDVVTTNFEAATKTIFYQLTAPLGWVIHESTYNNRMIYVNSAGSPATLAGNWSDESDALTSSGGSHYHIFGEFYASGFDRGFELYHDQGSSTNYTRFYVDDSSCAAAGDASRWTSGTSGVSNGDKINSSTDGSHTHDMYHRENEHEYSKVVLAEKS